MREKSGFHVENGCSNFSVLEFMSIRNRECWERCEEKKNSLQTPNSLIQMKKANIQVPVQINSKYLDIFLKNN